MRRGYGAGIVRVEMGFGKARFCAQDAAKVSADDMVR